MWKEQHDAGNTPLEVASAELPELSAEALVEIVTGTRDADRQKLKSEDNLQTEEEKFQKRMEPVALPTMSTYTDALNKFTKNATEFIEHLPLLAEARDAYVQAMKASKELRHVLDSGDQKLQTLMIRMERMANINILESTVERKKPEGFKIEPIRATDQSTIELKKSV